PAEQPGAPRPVPARVDPADLLEQILGGAPDQPRPAERSPGEGDWQSFLRQVMEPHLLPRTDYAKQAELLAAVDEAAGRQMRAVLHHPHFQAVEAVWRAAYFLTRRLPTDAHLRLYLLDVSGADLGADLMSADDLATTGLYRILVDRVTGPAGDPPWAVVAGLYDFGQGPEDIELLGRIARVARRAG